MGVFDPPVSAVREAVARALAEDLLPLGDVTAALLPPAARAEAQFVSRAAGVVAGTACATEAFAQLDGTVELGWNVADVRHRRHLVGRVDVEEPGQEPGRSDAAGENADHGRGP